jgi:predicted metal-binding membrane protein
VWSTGSAQLFGHDQDGVPAVLALALFLIGWLVMSAAMMLPSSLPTLRAIDQPGQTGQGARAASLMLGYFSAWAIFGVAAFAGDGMLHRAVELMPWLSERTWLIRAGIAMFAGAAEVLGRPAPPRTPEVPPGAGWFSVGKRHAVDRIRRCWPVMLFAMAVGMGNPLWMVGLTCVMALELRPRAHVALRIIGLGLLLLGAAVVIEPDWAPLLVGPGT